MNCIHACRFAVPLGLTMWCAIGASVYAVAQLA